MAINFFDPACISITSEEIFGIHDVPPATLDFNNSEAWIVWVENNNGLEITLTAVDHCLNIPRSEGERCEAILEYDDAIMFVELKEREGGRWAGKARDQLINSINLYRRDADLSKFRKLFGHIANKKKPYFRSGTKTFFQEFEDNTGFILRINDVITIE